MVAGQNGLSAIRSWVGEARAPAARPGSPARTVAASWLPGALAVAALTAVVVGFTLPMSNSLWGDEITSLFRYSGGGPSAIWSGYIPNDHMLYELLTWATSRLLGDHTFVATRFWSVAPAIATAVLLTVWLWRRLDPWVAAVFAALIGAAPLFLQTGMEGRGYGLASLGAALMLIGADWVARTRTRRGVVLFAVGGLIGLWTLPVFVLAFAAMAILLVVKGRQRRAVIVATGVVLVATFLFYLPVLHDVLSSAGQKDGQQLPVFGFVTVLLKHQLQGLVQTVVHPVSSRAANTFLNYTLSNKAPPAAALADVIAGVVVIGSAAMLLRNVERFLVAALLAPAVFTYLVLELARSYVISRFASFVLPGLLVLCAAGLVAGARWLARRSAAAPVVVLLGTALSVFVIVKAFELGSVNGRISSGPMISNTPAAFRRWIDPSELEAMSPPAFVRFACADSGAFVYLSYGPLPPGRGLRSCFAQRQAWNAWNVQADGGAGVRPGGVWDLGPKRS